VLLLVQVHQIKPEPIIYQAWTKVGSWRRWRAHQKELPAPQNKYILVKILGLWDATALPLGFMG
jgi:hypothetical protein